MSNIYIKMALTGEEISIVEEVLESAIASHKNEIDWMDKAPDSYTATSNVYKKDLKNLESVLSKFNKEVKEKGRGDGWITKQS